MTPCCTMPHNTPDPCSCTPNYSLDHLYFSSFLFLSNSSVQSLCSRISYSVHACRIVAARSQILVCPNEMKVQRQTIVDKDLPVYQFYLKSYLACLENVLASTRTRLLHYNDRALDLLKIIRLKGPRGQGLHYLLNLGDCFRYFFSCRFDRA